MVVRIGFFALGCSGDLVGIVREGCVCLFVMFPACFGWVV